MVPVTFDKDGFCDWCQEPVGVCECAPSAPEEGFAISGQPPRDGVAGGGDLDAVHRTFRRWFGEDYDVGALDVMLADAAAERLDGDPPWLLIVSGSGAAKTETVMALVGAGAVVVSTLSGEAALLSGTPDKDKASDAHGGLLRKIGSRGILVIKDVTSILSMSRDARDKVLAALREIYDGRWLREVGADGGRTLEWSGRLVVIGAVTTKWDSAHDVISAMGDRFVLVRIDSADKNNRRAAGRSALRGVSHESEMRMELAEAVGTFLDTIDPTIKIDLDDDVTDTIVDLADVVTLARTAVERDHAGNVVQAHAPEMPTRFAKQLAQIVRGGIAIGMGRDVALDVAVRCAGDTMPPLRLDVLGDVANNPASPPGDVVSRLQKPRKTVGRVLEECHLLGLLRVTEEPWGRSVRPVYSLAESVDADIVQALRVRRLARNGNPPSHERPDEHTWSPIDDHGSRRTGHDVPILLPRSAPR